MGVWQIVESLHKIECSGVDDVNGIAIIWRTFYVQTNETSASWGSYWSW